jgi:hypothetical protein
LVQDRFLNVFCSSDWSTIVFFDFFLSLFQSSSQSLCFSRRRHTNIRRMMWRLSQSLSAALGRKELTLVFYAANT